MKFQGGFISAFWECFHVKEEYWNVKKAKNLVQAKPELWKEHLCPLQNMIPGQAQRSLSGFYSPFAPLILSVLITWFPLIKHGRQTWITRERTLTTVISFHIEVSLQMVDLFSSHVCIMCMWLREISEFRKAFCAFVPKPPAMQCSAASRRTTEPCWALEETKAQIPSGSPSKKTAVLQQATGWQ